MCQFSPNKYLILFANNADLHVFKRTVKKQYVLLMYFISYNNYLIDLNKSVIYNHAARRKRSISNPHVCTRSDHKILGIALPHLTKSNHGHVSTVAVVSENKITLSTVKL